MQTSNKSGVRRGSGGKGKTCNRVITIRLKAENEASHKIISKKALTLAIQTTRTKKGARNFLNEAGIIGMEGGLSEDYI